MVLWRDEAISILAARQRQIEGSAHVGLVSHNTLPLLAVFLATFALGAKYLGRLGLRDLFIAGEACQGGVRRRLDEEGLQRMNLGVNL